MVVNPSMDGVVTFDAVDRSWRLQCGINALVLIETKIPDPLEVAALMQGKESTFETVRTGFWAALSDHHPELTEADAGRLVTHLGLAQAGAKLAQAMILAFPAIGEKVRP